MVMKELRQVFSKSNCLQGEKKIIIIYSWFCLFFLLNVNVLKEFMKTKIICFGWLERNDYRKEFEQRKE